MLNEAPIVSSRASEDIPGGTAVLYFRYAAAWPPDTSRSAAAVTSRDPCTAVASACTYGVLLLQTSSSCEHCPTIAQDYHAG